MPWLDTITQVMNTAALYIVFILFICFSCNMHNRHQSDRWDKRVSFFQVGATLARIVVWTCIIASTHSLALAPHHQLWNTPWNLNCGVCTLFRCQPTLVISVWSRRTEGLMKQKRDLRGCFPCIINDVVGLAKWAGVQVFIGCWKKMLFKLFNSFKLLLGMHCTYLQHQAMWLSSSVYGTYTWMIQNDWTTAKKKKKKITIRKKNGF